MCDNFGCDPYYGIKFAIFIVVMIVGQFKTLLNIMIKSSNLKGLHKEEIMNETWYTIEPSRHDEGQWDVISHGIYERGSVLEGQPKRSFIFGAPTKDECVVYCEGECIDYILREGSSYHPQPMSDLAPDWFDPADAGERWNDDY